jgi:hypothetical protein
MTSLALAAAASWIVHAMIDGVGRLGLHCSHLLSHDTASWLYIITFLKICALLDVVDFGSELQRCVGCY